MIVHSVLDFLHELGYYIILTISGVTVKAILWTPLLILAVSSEQRVVDGYVRVGPNWWLRHSDIRGDVA